MAEAKVQSEQAQTWRAWLGSFDDLRLAARLVEELPGDFLDGDYAPTEADRQAAWTVHTEMRTRITTERLHFRAGDEATALSSVHAIFGHTRDAIHAGGPDCAGFSEIAVFVLNRVIRPFTATWHGREQQGAFSNDDSCRRFRAELQELQGALREYVAILGRLATGRYVGEAQASTSADAPADVPLPPRLFIASDPALAEVMLKAETDDLLARREHLGLATPDPLVDVVGLSISGGGIRSATFALGVIEALTARNLLREVDYLSTVSGGGYLGTFLGSYLDSEAEAVGPGPNELPFRRGKDPNVESKPLRHLRNHSKYLLEGGLLARLGMFAQYVHGALINLVAMIPALLGLVVLAFGVCWAGLEGQTIRGFVESGAALQLPRWSTPVLLGYCVALLIVPLLHRLWNTPGQWARRHGNQLLAAVTLLAFTVAILPTALVWVHVGVHRLLGGGASWLGGARGEVEAALAVIGGVLQVVGGPLLQMASRRAGKLVAVALQIAAVLASATFFGLAYLLLFEWLFLSVDAGPFVASDWLRAGFVLVVAGVALAYAAGVVDINHTSPHRSYRDRLCLAYLVGYDGKGGVEQLDRKLLSELGSSAKSPYHLINCTLNLPGSRNLELRGREADFFIFSKRYCGSPILGYDRTETYEANNPELDLGTAMAISGAAAASRMGSMTIPGAPFLMTLLNVRMGYWLCAKDRKFGRLSAPGPLYLLAEIRGSNDEDDNFQNLSDGGHLENLGLYELLRRRCRYIVAIDGEGDGGLRCGALIKVIRLAEIDLGVTIDINLERLALTESGHSREHFALGRIHYGAGLPEGRLLYLKSSVTGDERDDIRDYRRKHPSFPHQSTADQLFDEAQFEAYRALGRHIGDALFARELTAGSQATAWTMAAWFAALSDSLLEPDDA